MNTQINSRTVVFKFEDFKDLIRFHNKLQYCGLEI